MTDSTPPPSAVGDRPARVGALVALALTAATLVAPGAFGSAFSGPPLGQPARWMLVGAVWLVAVVALVPPRRSIPLTVVLALGAGIPLQLWLGEGSVATGWRAQFEMVDAPPQRVALPWRFGSHDYRIDPAIQFDRDNIGWHFLNDLQRYGARIEPQPREVSVPIRATWTGVAYLPASAVVTVGVDAQGALLVRVSGTTLLSESGPAVNGTWSTDAPVPAGRVDLEVVYDKPAGVSPAVAVRVTTPVTGDLDVRPFDPAIAAPYQAPSTIDWSLAVVAVSVGVLFGTLLWAYAPGLPRSSRRRVGDIVARTALVGAFGWLLYAAAENAIPYTAWTFHMWSGDDPLAYVSNARNVILEGWLMPNGLPVGRGEPFYFYPVFPYVMGLAQAVIGEDFSVIRLVNGWSVAAVLPLSWALGWRDQRWWAAIAGMTALTWFIHAHMLPYALIGYTDSLFTGVVFLSLVCCRLAITRRGLWTIAAGVSCAIAAGTRPSFLTFTPLFILAIVLWGKAVLPGARLRVAAGVAAGFALGLAPFAIRNWIMSGKAVVLVSSWIQLPYFLVPPEVTPNPVPAMFSHTPSMFESVVAAGSLVLADPLGVLGLELRKVAFSLGMTHWGMPGGSVLHPELLVLTALFCAVLLVRRLPSDVRLVVATFAVSHLIAMVMAAPWTYGYKTILPLHAVFLFSAVYLLPGAARTPAPAHAN
ncbi:MAG: hypothetical protein KA371_07665 [Acidobacteria bacterium]|nr:hypothetical protein [Acidobacteriota bacterium]